MSVLWFVIDLIVQVCCVLLMLLCVVLVIGISDIVIQVCIVLLCVLSFICFIHTVRVCVSSIYYVSVWVWVWVWVWMCAAHLLVVGGGGVVRCGCGCCGVYWINRCLQHMHSFCLSWSVALGEGKVGEVGVNVIFDGADENLGVADVGGVIVDILSIIWVWVACTIL